MGYVSVSTVVVILAVAILQNSVAEDVQLENTAKAHPLMTRFRKPTTTPVKGNVPVYHTQAVGKWPDRIYTKLIRATKPVPVGPRPSHLRKPNNSNQINMMTGLRKPTTTPVYHKQAKGKWPDRIYTKLIRANRPLPVGQRKSHYFHQRYKKSLKQNNKSHTSPKFKIPTRPVPVRPGLTHPRKHNHFNQINKESPKQSNKPAWKPLKHPYPGGKQSKQQNLAKQKPVAHQPSKVPKKTTSVTAIATKDGASVSALAD